MKKFLAFALLCSCLSLVAFDGAAFATTEEDVATMQHPDGPQHDNVHCRICR